MCNFGGALDTRFSIEGSAFKQLISGGAGKDSHRRLRSWSILRTIFESCSLGCFLMFLWVQKPIVGLFWKSLESSGEFSIRCKCLTSGLLRLRVGKCEYIKLGVHVNCAEMIRTVYVPIQSTQKYITSPSLNTDYLLSYRYHAY